MKTPNCKDEMKSQLHRNLGLLHATKGDSKEALRNLAEDVRFEDFKFFSKPFLHYLVVIPVNMLFINEIEELLTTFFYVE